MTQIKVFSCGVQCMENAINEWLKENQNIKVLDIKTTLITQHWITQNYYDVGTTIFDEWVEYMVVYQI